MKIQALLVLFVFLAIQIGQAAPDTSSSTTQPTESPAHLMKRLAWWQNARFGMFVHWGPISLKGTEIGWSRIGPHADGAGHGGESIPMEEYDNLYKKFDPEAFSAKEWVAIAKAAGMKYMVVVAKHHDGFCMFDSKYTDYKITNTPFKRDYCAEIAKACHEAGMHLGFYYSPPDWHHPDFCTKDHAKYIEYLHNQIHELLTNYGKVDLLWFDADGGQNAPETWDNATLFPMIRKLQPDIILTKRAGGWGDYNTPEQHVGAFDNENPWETCMTICHQWAWKPDDQLKSLKECLQSLVLCAGGDGNFLFNVGPEPTGIIEPRQVDRLKELGAWLAKNGESIYGTRGGGPYKPAAYGASTRKGNLVYIHVFTWPTGSLTLPALPAKVISAQVLHGEKLQVNQSDTSLEISPPSGALDPNDTVVVLKLDKAAQSIPVIDVHS